MQKASIVAGAVVVALLAVFVWPTRFETRQGVLGGEQVMLRTDRLSGRVEYLSRYGGWRVAADAATASTTSVAAVPSLRPCTPAEAEKIKDNPYMATALGCAAQVAPAPAESPNRYDKAFSDLTR